jgi:hypothetical protein
VDRWHPIVQAIVSILVVIAAWLICSLIAFLFLTPILNSPLLALAESPYYGFGLILLIVMVLARFYKAKSGSSGQDRSR